MPRNSSPTKSPMSQKSIPKISLPSPPPISYQPQPTLFQSAIQGFGLGMGSSIARNIFETKQPVIINPPANSNPLTCYEYIKCLKLDDYSKNDCLSNLERTEFNNCEKLYK
jgi:hypothetical protein